MEPISMAMMAGGSLLGGLMGGQQQKTSTSPWKPQQQYLKDIFRQAQGLYNDRMGPYQGDTYAGMGSMAQQGLGALGDFSGYGLNNAYSQMGAGQGLYGAGNAALGAAGTLAGMAMQDPTQANINSAGQYANNPYLQGQINAANRDTARNLYENELPSANRMNSISGNQNSSRAGMREAMLTRAADDRMADTSAAMRGNAYSQGLGMAQGDRNAAMSYLGQAGNQMAGLFGQGMSASNTGQQNMLGMLNAMYQGGGMQQADAQGYLDQAFNKYNMADNYDAQKLAQYQAMVSGNYGGTSTSGGGLGGAMQGALGGAMAGGGLYKNIYGG